MRHEKTRNNVKYGMLSNSLFMVKEALGTNSVVLAVTLFQALLAVAISLMELYVAPTILGNLERHDALGTMIGSIGFFALGIMGLQGLSAYLENNQIFMRIPIRLSIISKMWRKAGTCSYPVRESQDFIRSFTKATDASIGNDSATEYIWSTFAGLLQNLVGFCIYLYLLTHADPVIIIVTLAAAVISYLASSYFNGWGYRHRQEEAEIKNRFFYFRGRARDRQLAKDVRIFGIGGWLREMQDKNMRMLQDFYLRRERVCLLADFTDVALSFLRNGIAYAWLLYLAVQGSFSASEFLFYFTAVSGFTAWITGIMDSVSRLRKQSLDLSCIREMLDYEEPFLFEKGKALEVMPGTEYTIELKDVTFRYPGAEKETFFHLNLTLHPGEKLAVVGANGAGKTTLVRLLCGLYDPDEGEVLLNGVNIKEYNRRDYYQLFSAVFQEFSLLAGEIGENVACFEQETDSYRMRDCMEKAGLAGKVEALPEGYGTHLVKGVYDDAVELSGGEQQRLVMARLLYKDSPVMILDEPTAALDAIAESDIYRKYHELSRGKSSVFISHRLASTRFCDRIILLRDGKVAEEGTHEELMTLGKSYAELFRIQSRYYVDRPGENE